MVLERIKCITTTHLFGCVRTLFTWRIGNDLQIVPCSDKGTMVGQWTLRTLAKYGNYADFQWHYRRKLAVLSVVFSSL